MSGACVIRAAVVGDVGTMLRFIRELAEYEREPDAVETTEADLLRDGWGAVPRFRCVMAEVDGEAVGFALFFTSYSTWRGRHGIRLEDLYVTPAGRGRGVGKELLRHLAGVAVSEGCKRLEWDVLEWNVPAIGFYEAMGARLMGEWRIMRVADAGLDMLAGDDRSAG